MGLHLVLYLADDQISTYGQASYTAMYVTTINAECNTRWRPMHFDVATMVDEVKD